MICYLLQQSPLWNGVPNGKRNVRIMFVSFIAYILIHALAFEYKDQSLACKIIHGWFLWFILTDIITCACLYKLYYGRTILKELNDYEKDVYDEKTHTYLSGKQIEKEDPVETPEIDVSLFTSPNKNAKKMENTEKHDEKEKTEDKEESSKSIPIEF